MWARVPLQPLTGHFVVYLVLNCRWISKAIPRDFLATDCAG